MEETIEMSDDLKDCCKNHLRNLLKVTGEIKTTRQYCAICGNEMCIVDGVWQDRYEFIQ